MAVEHFSSDGVDIAFLASGEGDPILLIHGFASNHVVNWGATGWIDTLKRAGRRIIAMDVRGHGKSAKLRDPASYSLALMAADAIRLLDHLGIPRADVMGYSMGARITVALALAHQGRMRSIVLGGMGYAMVAGMGGEDEIVAALEAPSLEAVRPGPGLAYRKFAEQTGSDMLALAACLRKARQTFTPEQLATIHVPTLIAIGDKDGVAGSAEGLAALIPGAEVFVIPNRDHMLATGDKHYKAAVLEFLERLPP
ncbi:MAG: alpha/beta fold hydrolase [Bauldia sp.]|nr:alpha/beta fold hydrolase [Bauldia sp.]